MSEFGKCVWLKLLKKKLLGGARLGAQQAITDVYYGADLQTIRRQLAPQIGDVDAKAAMIESLVTTPHRNPKLFVAHWTTVQWLSGFPPALHTPRTSGLPSCAEDTLDHQRTQALSNNRTFLASRCNA